MWTIVCILKSEFDSETAVETHPVEFSDYPIWCPARLSLDGFELEYNNFIFDFVLHSDSGRVLITSKTVPVGRFNYIKEIENDSPSVKDRNFPKPTSYILNLDNMSITYVAYKYNEQGFEKLGQIQISSISLRHDITGMKFGNGHKVTCMINDMYLSRPQECKTESALRTYYWKGIESPRGEKDFENLKRDNSDLAIIKKKTASILDYVPDNDAFVNLTTKLPMYFQDDDNCLNIRFYNFKFMPPKYIETKLYWHNFMFTVSAPPQLDTKRGIMKRKLSPRPVKMCMTEKKISEDLTLVVHFYVLEAKKIEIIVIYLRAENYEKSLSF